MNFPDDKIIIEALLARILTDIVTGKPTRTMRIDGIRRMTTSF